MMAMVIRSVVALKRVVMNLDIHMLNFVHSFKILFFMSFDTDYNEVTLLLCKVEVIFDHTIDIL